MRPEVVLTRLRRFLLALSVVLLAGAVAELWFVEHTEDPIQLIPFVLSGLGGAAVIVALLRPNRASLWALRLVMLLVVLGSLLGVYLHVESNYGLERELYPDRPAGQLLLGALGGANPLLAPGVLAVAAVLALAATYQHPAIAKRGGAQPLGKGEGVIGRRGEAGKRDGAAAGNEVEAAGETTAAATVGGDAAEARPVGADTQVRVEGDAHPADEADG
ncbi:MAG TPA: hypothetical protein VK421_20320 [Pyrinomonadaceae bacterium]|nr:hypothetical protein [Pyrinomonadaceae bacterium]